MADKERSLFSGVGSKDVMFFTSQLSLLLETGCNLAESLQVIAAQTENPRMKRAVVQVTADVTEGKMLSTALARRPRIFSLMYVSMVRAGEMGGFLPQMLQKMTQFQKRQQTLKSKILSSLAYPAALTTISLGVTIFMITYVLPKFLVVFEGKEEILPITTKCLMAMTAVLTKHWPLILAGLGGFVVSVVVFFRTAVGAVSLDYLKVWSPMFGSVYRSLCYSRLLRTLGVMLDSGIPLLDGVEVTRGTVGSLQFQQFLDRVSNSVQQGQTLSEQFTTSSLFPASIKQMLSTSELTGTSGTVMLRLAEHYEEDVETRMQTLTSLLEPGIVVAMGSVVGFIALSLFLPLFKLSSGALN